MVGSMLHPIPALLKAGENTITQEVKGLNSGSDLLQLDADKRSAKLLIMIE